MRHESSRLVHRCDVLRSAGWFECGAAGRALAARVHAESSKSVRPERRAEWRGVSRAARAVPQSVSFHEKPGMNGGCFWLDETCTGIRHESSRLVRWCAVLRSAGWFDVGAACNVVADRQSGGWGKG